MNLEEEINKLKLDVESLKKDSHPPKGLLDLDGAAELIKKISKLEDLIYKAQ